MKKKDYEMILSKDEIKKVIEEVRSAAMKYYEEGEDSPLSDDEYDAKQDFLTEVYESGEFPELFVEGSDGFNVLELTVAAGVGVASSDEVLHETEMLSLKKAKKEEELISFLDSVESHAGKEFKIQAKLDGLALSVFYNDGVVEKIATRGTGKIGQDVSYLVSAEDVSVLGLPEEINEKSRFEVRGELLFSNSQFKEVNEARFALTGENFMNSRNAGAGLLKKAKLGVDFPVEFTFIVYSSNVLSVEELEEDGFITVDSLVDYGVLSRDEVMDKIHAFDEVREDLEYPTDGVVVKPVDEVKMHELMGSTAHHPSSQIAWKYPSEKIQTVIRGVELTVGKSGRVNPRAIFDPIILGSARVSKSTLHNFNKIEEMGVKIGSVVLVEKANEIIPQVFAVVANPEDAVEIEVPTDCPVCETELVGDSVDGEVPKTLLCPNEDCPSRDFYALVAAVGRTYLNIDRLSTSVLEYLFEEGIVRNIVDLYHLDLETLANAVNGYTADGTPRRLGEKTSEHILSYIEASKSLPPHRVLASLAIRSLGRTVSESLLNVYTIDELLEADFDDLIKVPNVGPIGARDIIDGLKAKRGIIDGLREVGFDFSVEEEESDGALEGLSFSISGSVPEGFKNRNELVEFIKEQGGEFHSNPRKATRYMIGDPSDSSSKVKRAVSLGVEFISPDEFNDLV